MIEIPSNCPSCDGPLTKVNMQLFCKNKGCPAQTLKKIQHFAKVMGIKGLGEKTLEKLDFETYHDLYYFSPQYFTDTLGAKVGTKILAEIEASKSVPLNQGIAAFGIPLIGETAGRKLAEVCSSIEDIDFETCKKAGLGEKASNNLLWWLEEQEYKGLPINFLFEKTTKSSSNGYVVCITGKLNDYKNRSEAKAFLETLGCTVVDSITTSTNVLIVEDGKTSSSKYKQALSRNIKICSIKELESEIIS